MRLRFTLILLSVLASQPAAAEYSDLNANQDMDRTVNRTVPGRMFMDNKYFQQPEFSEFLSTHSNHDAQNQHPQQWAGQDWDPAAWNKSWTPEVAIDKFYENRVFHKAFLRRGKIPVLEVGPMFYKLSDLDQRRALKLIADHEGVFTGGYDMIELRDWQDHSVIGSYTQQGMILN